MTTKAYLYQLRNIDRRIQDKIRESCECKEIALGKSTALNDIKVQCTPNQEIMADAVAHAVDYEREASALATQMTDLKHQIIEQIDGIEDEKVYNVLKEHFVQQVGIGTLADKYDLTYNAMKWRIKQAIIQFEKIYGKEW